MLLRHDTFFSGLFFLFCLCTDIYFFLIVRILMYESNDDNIHCVRFFCFWKWAPNEIDRLWFSRDQIKIFTTKKKQKEKKTKRKEWRRDTHLNRKVCWLLLCFWDESQSCLAVLLSHSLYLEKKIWWSISLWLIRRSTH